MPKIFLMNGYNGRVQEFKGEEEDAQSAAEEYSTRTVEEGLPAVIYFFARLHPERDLKDQLTWVHC